MRDDAATLYGAKGWGSVLVEAMLIRCGAPYDFVDVEGFDRDSPQRAQLIALNPLAQVPTLVLADGTVMTESVAIALLLAERYPAAGLAPAVDSPERPLFLRRLVWLAASVYSTFLYADYPERWAPEAAEAFQERVRQHRRDLWSSYERALASGAERADPALATGLFVCAMTRWGPGRAWFDANCPNLSAIARVADQAADLKPVWARNFPAAS